MVKKITVSQLRKGMFLCGTDRKWLDLPFFRTSFLISSDKQIKTLQEYCQLVEIDTGKGLDLIESVDAQDMTQTAIEPESAPSQAANLYEQSLTNFSVVLKEVRLGHPIDVKKLDEIAENLLAGICIDPQASLMQSLLGSTEILAQKSLNVAILAAAFGGYLALPPASLRTLVMGALLHDIGMIEMPHFIAAKTESLTPAERIVLEQHPELGVAILRKTPELGAEVIEIVANHHEQMNGGGYPQRLSAAGLGDLTRVVSIVSVYQALINERPYRQSLPPLAAMDFLYHAGQLRFDTALVASFIRMQAQYPLDCVVCLHTGELAIVVSGNEQQPEYPQLGIVTNSQKQLLFEEQTLDLAQTQNQDVTIGSVLASDDPIIELLKIFTAQEKH